MAGVGVFPGSFNPPTVAHLSMAAAVLQHFDLERLDLAVSLSPLAKEEVAHPLFEHQVTVLKQSLTSSPGLCAVVTEKRLLADIGEGYDVMVLGADKWHQIQELKWYGSIEERDGALGRLPRLLVFPRAGAPPPPADVAIDSALLPNDIETVSSTRARAGELNLMTPQARAFAQGTGSWIDVERYDRWLADGGTWPEASQSTN